MPATATVTGAITGPADALARLAAARDAEAWAWLLEHLGPQMRTVAARLSDDPAAADDAVQEALLAVRDHAGSFIPRSAPDDDARRWVVRIAANAALQARRSRRRARARDARSGGATSTPDAASTGLEREETAILVRDALAGLGEAERAAIVLHVVGGLGYDQVAAELRCPVGTAKTRVHRGLERLRSRLGRRAHALSAVALTGQLSQGTAPQAPLAVWSGLLQAPAHAHAALLPTLGGITMTAKLAIACVAAVAIALPAALVAQDATGEERTQDVAVPPVRAAAAVVPAPVAGTVAARIDAVLAQKIFFDFQDTALEDAVEFLEHVTGIPVGLHGDVGRNPPAVTLQVKDMAVRDALKWISELTNTRSERLRTGLILCAAPLAPDRSDFSGAPASWAAGLAAVQEVRFSDQPLEDAVGLMRAVTKLNLVVEPDMQQRNPRFYLSASGAPAQDVLADIARLVGGAWTVRNQALILSALPAAAPVPEATSAGTDEF